MKTIAPGTKVIARDGVVRVFGGHEDLSADHHVQRGTMLPNGGTEWLLFANTAYVAPAAEVKVPATSKAVKAVKDEANAEGERVWRIEATLADGTVETFYHFTKKQGVERGVHMVAIDRWHNS